MADQPEPKVESTTSDNEKFPASDWPDRASWFAVEGISVSRHAIVGALADSEPGQKFTRAQVEKRVTQFLAKEAT